MASVNAQILHALCVTALAFVAPARGAQPVSSSSALRGSIAIQKGAVEDLNDLGKDTDAEAEEEGEGGVERPTYGDQTDYREDVAAFLRSHRAHSCKLPMLSHNETYDKWVSMIQEGDQAEADDVRGMFPQKLFGGPGLVTGLAEGWKARHQWEEENMRKRLRQRDLYLDTFSYPEYVVPRGHITLEDYLDQNRSKHNEFIFLDLAEYSKAERGHFTDMLQDLRGDYEPLPSFAPSLEERAPIIAFDGIGSGHGLHHHGPVWQTQVIGRKAWWLMPASVPAFKHAIPVVNGNADRHPNPCVFLKRSKPPPGTTFCVVEPGETLLLPEDTWHATCGLDTYTASIGGFLNR